MKVLQFTLPVKPGNSVIVQQDRLPWFYNYLHRHKEIQITLVIKGEGTLIAGNYMHPFRPGEIYIIGANQPHLFKSDPSCFKIKKKDNVASLTFFFSSHELFGTLLDLPEMKKIKQFMEKITTGMQVPQREQRVLASEIESTSKKKGALLLSDFIKLLHRFSGIRKWKTLSTENNAWPISDVEGLRMNDIYQYTMLHYTEPIRLEQIAAVAHLTVPSFCRYFKKHTRKTYIRFLNEVKVNEACKKLLEGKYQSISAVAYDTGFVNTTTFNRIFRQIMGMPPHQYLQDYKQTM